MQELNLPHIAPIKFAKKVLFKEGTKARVDVAFTQVPTLGMMIESAAQSSASFGDETTQSGFLVSLKNVKLLSKASKTSLEVTLEKEHDLGAMSYFSFVVLEGTKELVNGSFVIAKS